jgi:hypothetical protein
MSAGFAYLRTRLSSVRFGAFRLTLRQSRCYIGRHIAAVGGFGNAVKNQYFEIVKILARRHERHKIKLPRAPTR